MRQAAIILLLLVMLAVPLTATAQDSLSQSYTSRDNSISFNYPNEWAVEENNEGLIIVVSDNDIFDADIIPRGEAEMVILSPPTLHTLTGNATQNVADPQIAATAVAEELKKGNLFEISDISDPIEVTIGEQTGWCVYGHLSDTGWNAEVMLVFFLVGNDFMLFVGAAYHDEMSDFEPLFLDIAATITYAPVPGVGALAGVGSHLDDVTSAAYSPDGMLVATGSADKTVKLWDAAEGIPLWTLEAHTDEVNIIAFSPDGSMLASGSTDHTIILWDIASKKRINTLETPFRVYSLSFSPDGALLAASGNRPTLQLWDVATGDAVRTFEGHTNYVNSLAFSPDGSLLVSASDDQSIRLWSVTTGEAVRVFEGHKDRVNSVAFSPDGAFLVSGSNDKTIHLWNVTTGEIIRTFKGHAGAVECVVFSPDGMRIASGSLDNTVRLWDVQSGNLLQTFEGHTNRVNSVTFNPDSTRIVSASDDSTIHFWDIPGDQ